MSEPASPIPNLDLYPDVLGTLSNERFTLDEVLQCALGIFPTKTALGQPLEAVVLLQNLIDQPLALQFNLRLPRRTPDGAPINLSTPRPRLGILLPGGESGALYLPITPQPPTPPGIEYPLQLQIAVQKPAEYQPVRPANGGRRPGQLSISPHKVAVLRDIRFTVQSSEASQLCGTFNVLPGYIVAKPPECAPRYEALWTERDLKQDLAKAQAMAAEALRFAHSLQRAEIYPELLSRTRVTFGDAGMPVHDGEALFITKLLLYILEDGLETEDGFSLAGGQWFHRLCWVLAHNPGVIHYPDQLVRTLYPSLIYDAVRLGLCLLARQTQADFGDETEQAAYAVKVMNALERRTPPGIEYVYVPLVLAGTTLTTRIIVPGENPWHSLEMLKESHAGRVSSANRALREVFDLLNTLIGQAEQDIREKRIPHE